MECVGVSGDSSESTYQCDVCRSVFLNSLDLLYHKQMHDEEELVLNYKCDECGSRFALERQLNRHVLSHSEELKPFRCEDCGLRFKLKTQLVIHVRKHDMSRQYVCPHCGYRYEQNTHLQSHMKSHEDIRPYICDICHSAFKRAYDMKTHRSTHSEVKLFYCQECNSDFKKQAYLNKHMKTHTEDRFSCELCGAIFKEKRALVGHVRVHSREKNKCFVCHICDQNQLTAKQLQDHVKSHQECSPASTGKTSHCYECGCNFMGAKALELHKSLQHDGETLFQCQFCRANFTQDTYLMVHVMKHISKSIFCIQCTRYCHSEYEMGVHEWEHTVEVSNEAVEISNEAVEVSNGAVEVSNEAIEISNEAVEISNEAVEVSNKAVEVSNEDIEASNEDIEVSNKAVEASNERGNGIEEVSFSPSANEDLPPYRLSESIKQVLQRYSCEDCGCLFHSLNPLEQHRKLQHKGEMPFQCSLCMARFNKARFLNVHMFKHLKKKVLCLRCKKNCKSEYELGMHDCQKEEREESRFYCDNCGCSFTSQKLYSLHCNLQHEGIMPYTCQRCKATFTQEKFLNVHQYKHVKKVIICVRCNAICNSEYEAGNHVWHHFVSDNNQAFAKPEFSELETVNSNEMETVNFNGMETFNMEGMETDNLSGVETDNLSGVETVDLNGIEKVDLNGMETVDLNGMETVNLPLDPKQFLSLVPKFHCDNCCCTFDFENAYKLHLEYQHTGKCKYGCKKCSATFTKEIFLSVHVFKHVEKSTECRVCKKISESVYEAGIHEWIDHYADSCPKVEYPQSPKVEEIIPRKINSTQFNQSRRSKRIKQNIELKLQRNTLLDETRAIDSGNLKRVEEMTSNEGGLQGDKINVAYTTTYSKLDVEIKPKNLSFTVSNKSVKKKLKTNTLWDRKHFVDCNKVDHVLILKKDRVETSPNKAKNKTAKSYFSSNILDPSNITDRPEQLRLKWKINPCFVKMERISINNYKTCQNFKRQCVSQIGYQIHH